MTARVDELDYCAAVVALNGSPPWLGALIETAQPLTAQGISSFGRFVHPSGVQYVFIDSTAAWEREGTHGAVVWIYLVDGSRPARPPRRRASQVRGFSLPSEAEVTDDLSLQVSFDMLALDRWDHS